MRNESSRRPSTVIEMVNRPVWLAGTWRNRTPNLWDLRRTPAHLPGRQVVTSRVEVSGMDEKGVDTLLLGVRARLDERALLGSIAAGQLVIAFATAGLKPTPPCEKLDRREQKKRCGRMPL